MYSKKSGKKLIPKYYFSSHSLCAVIGQFVTEFCMGALPTLIHLSRFCSVFKKGKHLMFPWKKVLKLTFHEFRFHVLQALAASCNISEDDFWFLLISEDDNFEDEILHPS